MGCTNQKSKTIIQCNYNDENPVSNKTNKFQVNNEQKIKFLISPMNQRRRFLLNTIPKLNLSSNDLYKRRKFRSLPITFDSSQ